MVLVGSLALYCGCSVLCGLSWSLAWLVVFRALQAIGVAAQGVVSGGVVADLFAPEWRGRAMGLLALPALASPVLGPPLGGVMAQFVGWRSVLYLMGALSLPSLLLIFLFQPETLMRTREHTPQHSAHQRHVGERSDPLVHSLDHPVDQPLACSLDHPGDQPVDRSLDQPSHRPLQHPQDHRLPQHNPASRETHHMPTNPLRPLLLLGEPAIGLVSLQVGLVFGGVFFLIEVLPDAFASAGYSQTAIGLSLVPFGVGCLLGSVVGGQLSDVAARFFGGASNTVASPVLLEDENAQAPVVYENEHRHRHDIEHQHTHPIEFQIQSQSAQPGERQPLLHASASVRSHSAQEPGVRHSTGHSHHHQHHSHHHRYRRSQAAGALSRDIVARLWPSLLASLLSSIATLAAAYLVHVSLVAAACTALLSGFAYTGSRPGYLAFLLELCPSEASSVSASLTSATFLISTLTLTVGPLLTDAAGLVGTFLVYAGLAWVALVPLVLFVLYHQNAPAR
jgi:MFS family permease